MPHNSNTYELVSIKRDASHVTKIWKCIAPEPDTEEPVVPDCYLEHKLEELDSLNAQIEAITSTPIYRPPYLQNRRE
jgi:hypothetical protein